jgi:hypothetical protein
MKRKNAFVLRSDQARSYLMKWTGMDELDYQLAILEGGCWYLEQLVHPISVVSEELVREYREHLTALGYWSFYEWVFRSLEVRLVNAWSATDALELLQPQPWCRARLLEEVKGLPWSPEAARQLDTWLKVLEPTRTTKTTTEPNLIPH